MAPEVVAGGVATAKSDIYALGVLLYQLVTGDLRRPMAPGWESDIEDPLLREDIAKAANGQPDERMASAGELASRLDKLDQRRLQRVEDEHRSIEQANLANQIRRAQARRPWLIAVVFALFAGLGTSLVFMKRAQDAEQETQEQLDSQTALLNFMTNDVLGQASPDVSQSASTTIREAIDNAVEKLDQRFEGKPLIEGKIRVAIGVVYSNLTDLEAAGKQILRARDLLAPANTEPSKLFIDTYTLNIQNLGRLGRFEEANQELDELQEWIQSYPDATPEQWARFYASKVMNLGAVGRHAEAAIAAEKSLEFAQASGKLSENNMDWLSVQRAYQTMLAGKLVEARELYEELIPRMAARDPTYSHRTDAEMNYAELLIQTGDVQKGITIAQRLQGTLTELLGPDHPAVASIYALLGEGYLKKKDFSEAVGEYRKAYDIFLSAFSPSSPYTLETGQAYARCLVAAGNIQEADQLLAQLDANASESLPTDSPLGASIAWERAYLALDAETPAVAESLLPRISAAVLESDQSSGDWDAKVKLLRGRIALSRGDKPEALSQLQDAIDGLQDIESDPSLVEDAHKYKAAAESLP